MRREANSRPILTSLVSGNDTILFKGFHHFRRLEVSGAESNHCWTEGAFIWGIDVYTFDFLELLNDFGGDIPTPLLDFTLTNFPEKLNLLPERVKGGSITLA